MFEEIAPSLIEALIENKNQLSIDDLVNITDYEKPVVSRCLRILTELGLVSSKSSKLSLNREVKAIQIASAAQLGMDLSTFGTFFKIDKKERATAIEIASSVDKVKSLDPSKKRPMVQNRSYLTVKNNDEVSAILVNLLEATNNSLYEYLIKLSSKDKHLKSLLDLHQSAEDSLISYLKGM